ncbi:MAG: M56 family metallopeptidase, partial [Bacillota bacterium]|nr:M56 family metallopeptidase [Bacillota bacterium]
MSLSLLYIAYRLLMHRETFFKLNRTVLLLAVLYSMTIPFLYSPKLLTVQPELKPVFQHVNISEEPIQVLDEPVTVPQSPQPILVRETIRPVALSASAIFTIVYLTGVFISLVLLVYSINRVLLLFRKARQTDLNGIRLMVVAEDIPTFSFGRNILISQHDYENNSEAIITHEQSHIRLGHFYDLMLMELVKIIFWFNPLVYRLMRDLKEIHEFQADDQALNSGIDATKYQLLIIQKSVGQQRFALANSFNHCQIKNRIVMMNKQKTSKAWRWKVAAFLPLLALLLMAFGKPGENVNSKKVSTDLDTVKNATPGKLHTKKFTPPEISDIKIPKRNTFSMQVDARGKVFVGF